jgi:hypothetical protein
MGTCFVIQPFDNAEYDRRFDEIYATAIRDAGLEPYRVDRDASVIIPIANIEDGIRQATACLAEINTDNPNVWFELGFAIAEKKEIVIICKKSRREKFPFDIQHRTVISYNTDSPSDFDELKKSITDRMKHSIARAEKVTFLEKEAGSIKEKKGLADYEIAILASIAAEVDTSFSSNDSPDRTMSHRAIADRVEKLGYTALAASIGLRKLESKRFVRGSTEQDRDGDWFKVYQMTDAGWDWLMENEEQFALKKSQRSVGLLARASADDDIPF